jgi:dephospho-CoA kinase
MARNGLDKKAAQARLDSQLSNAERLKRADVVVENSGSANELTQRCKALHAELLALAEQRRASHAQGMQTHRKED